VLLAFGVPFGLQPIEIAIAIEATDSRTPSTLDLVIVHLPSFIFLRRCVDRDPAPADFVT
jgi:hypothetical protein